MGKPLALSKTTHVAAKRNELLDVARVLVEMEALATRPNFIMVALLAHSCDRLVKVLVLIIILRIFHSFYHLKTWSRTSSVCETYSP